MPMRLPSIAPARALAIVALGAVALSLGSCAGGIGPGSGVRASAEACSAVTDGIGGALSRFQDVDAADPAAAAAAVEDVAAELAEARARIDDAALTAVVGDLQDEVAALADALAAVNEGELSRAPELGAATDGIRRSVTEFTRLCGEG